MSAMEVDSKGVPAVSRNINPPIMPLYLGDWKSNPAMSTERKALYAKLAMIPATATAAQRRRTFESAVATQMTDVKTNPAANPDSAMQELSVIEKETRWIDLFNEAAKVGRPLKMPFFGLQVALYAVIATQPVAWYTPNRLMACIRTAADAVRPGIADNGFENLDNYSSENGQQAFALLDLLNIEFEFARKPDEAADYHRLAALAERCFTRSSLASNQSSVGALMTVQIMQDLIANPMKAIYRTRRRFKNRIENPVHSFAYLVRTYPTYFDAAALQSCLKNAWLAQPDRPTVYPKWTNDMKENISFLEELENIYDRYREHANVAAFAEMSAQFMLAIASTIRQMEECLWPTSTVAATAASGSAAAAAAAPSTSGYFSNIRFGAPGISVEPATTSANYHAANYSEFGRPIKPKGAMTPAKPTVVTKQGGGAVFRPTDILCFF